MILPHQYIPRYMLIVISKDDCCSVSVNVAGTQHNAGKKYAHPLFLMLFSMMSCGMSPRFGKVESFCSRRRLVITHTAWLHINLINFTSATYNFFFMSGDQIDQWGNDPSWLLIGDISAPCLYSSMVNDSSQLIPSRWLCREASSYVHYTILVFAYVQYCVLIN